MPFLLCHHSRNLPQLIPCSITGSSYSSLKPSYLIFFFRIVSSLLLPDWVSVRCRLCNIYFFMHSHTLCGCAFCFLFFICCSVSSFPFPTANSCKNIKLYFTSHCVSPFYTQLIPGTGPIRTVFTMLTEFHMHLAGKFTISTRKYVKNALRYPNTETCIHFYNRDFVYEKQVLPSSTNAQRLLWQWKPNSLSG